VPVSWNPPWPPIQVAADEWVLVRDSPRRASAVVRRFMGARGTYFRVVTWAERSEDRRLVGRFRSLEEADRSVKFTVPKAGSEYAGYPAHTDARHPWTLAEQELTWREKNG